MPGEDTLLPSASRLAGVEREAVARGLWNKISTREPQELAAYGIDSLSAFVAYAATHDPHEVRKPFTSWLVNTYAAGGFLLKDFEQAKSVLRSFRRWQGTLPQSARDLNTYSTLDAVSAALPLGEQAMTASKRKADRLEALAVRAETNFLMERGDGFVMAQPLTERAAKWWGRGTKWCTSADKDNRFAQHFRESPLTVLRWADGSKLQAWGAPGCHSQLRDEADLRPELDFLRDHFDDVRPVMMRLLETDGSLLRILPSDIIDTEMAITALRQTDSVIAAIPESLLDRNFFLAVVTENGEAMRHVPIEFQDRELRRAAVAQCGMALRWVRERLRDTETCLIAVRADPLAMRYVPEALRDTPSFADFPQPQNSTQENTLECFLFGMK